MKWLSRVLVRLPHGDLFWRLLQREISLKYQGSAFGLVWAILHPIFMLAVYTFFFGLVFRSRWTGVADSTSSFALILFSGLMVFNFFSESITRSCSLIVNHANYVKKVIFPVAILPVVSVFSALFSLLLSFVVWLVFYLLLQGWPPVSVLLFPLMLLPVFLAVLGMSWLLAAIGVYFRDASQLVSMLAMAMCFLSPVFYPLSMLPAELRYLAYLNPLGLAIEMCRDVLYFGHVPHWPTYGLLLLLSVMLAWAGYAAFCKLKRGFADVL